MNHPVPNTWHVDVAEPERRRCATQTCNMQRNHTHEGTTIVEIVLTWTRLNAVGPVTPIHFVPILPILVLAVDPAFNTVQMHVLRFWLGY